MRITISIGVGRHPTPYRLAEFLERQGALEHIISPMPRFRLEPLALDNRHLVTFPWVAYLNYGLSKLPYFKGVTPRQFWLAELTDKTARERLGECDVFDGWCTTSLWSMRRARERGALVVLQTGSAHIAYQAELLEMEYAKLQLRKTMVNNGMGMQAGPCHPQFTGFYHPQPFTRMTWPTQTFVPLSGAASYYAWRSMATATDDFHAREFPVTFTCDEELMFFTFESGDKSQIMIAAWDPETLVDGIAEVKTDVILHSCQAGEAWAIDIFNGTEQALNLSVEDNNTVFKSMLIKDYPTFIRIKK